MAKTNKQNKKCKHEWRAVSNGNYGQITLFYCIHCRKVVEDEEEGLDEEEEEED